MWISRILIQYHKAVHIVVIDCSFRRLPAAVKPRSCTIYFCEVCTVHNALGL